MSKNGCKMARKAWQLARNWLEKAHIGKKMPWEQAEVGPLGSVCSSGRIRKGMQFATTLVCGAVGVECVAKRGIDRATCRRAKREEGSLTHFDG